MGLLKSAPGGSVNSSAGSKVSASPVFCCTARDDGVEWLQHSLKRKERTGERPREPPRLPVFVQAEVFGGELSCLLERFKKRDPEWCERCKREQHFLPGYQIQTFGKKADI